MKDAAESDRATPSLEEVEIFIARIPEKSQKLFSQGPAKSLQPVISEKKLTDLNPKEFLKLYSDKLTDLEKSEIQNLQKIYFIGDVLKRVEVPKSQNFDDEEGYYTVEPGEHLLWRF